MKPIYLPLPHINLYLLDISEEFPNDTELELLPVDTTVTTRLTQAFLQDKAKITI